ncbi:uncharacterized protein TNCV_745381 [Trichonephila clavipes]|nr:uncharacterized protein TNCV_745381 [Trichonephila clavipes]
MIDVIYNELHSIKWTLQYFKWQKSSIKTLSTTFQFDPCAENCRGYECIVGHFVLPENSFAMVKENKTLDLKMGVQDVTEKKVFKTAEEAVKYLLFEELEFEMIALPPEVDELTYEDGFDDTASLDPSVRNVAGSIKIAVPFENHDDHRETDLSNKSKKKKRSCSESGSNTRKKGKK